MILFSSLSHFIYAVTLSSQLFPHENGKSVHLIVIYTKNCEWISIQPITRAQPSLCRIRKLQPKEKMSSEFHVSVTSFKTKVHFDTETLDTSCCGRAGLLVLFLMDGTDSLLVWAIKRTKTVRNMAAGYGQSACLNAAIKFHVCWLLKDDFSFDRSHEWPKYVTAMCSSR